MDIQVGEAFVKTTDNRGLSTEELSKNCADKIVHVSEDANPAIRDQAIAFKESVRRVVQHYMDQAIQSDRTTLANKLKQSGEGHLAEVIRRL